MRAANHAGICRLFDVMQTPSHIYLVLEKGDRDLYALIDDYPGGCPENVVKSATRILVLALRHCHNAKIAHRDIKPENILVCGDPHTWHQNPDAGIVKLCDFGLCADIPGGRRFTAGLCWVSWFFCAGVVAAAVVRRRAGRLILVGRGAYIKWSRRVYAIDATREKRLTGCFAHTG